MAHLPVHRPTLAERGFTLIELMIVVAIIGILAAVALPSYNDYLRRGQLPEAFTYLANYRVQLEQYYQDNRNYGATNCADVSGASAIVAAPAGTKYFTYTCTLTGSGQRYTLTATGVSGNLSNGHAYTVDESNTKTTTAYPSRTGLPVNCWLVKGSEC